MLPTSTLRWNAIRPSQAKNIIFGAFAFTLVWSRGVPNCCITRMRFSE
jgi:hypothetical protein